MIDWKTLQDWEEDWLQVSRLAIRRRREFLQRTLHLDRWLLTMAIERVRAGRKDLVNEFAYGFKDQLDPDSSVATTHDLDRLLVLAQMHESGKDPEPHRWFDAIGVFDQSVAVAMLEREDPAEAVGRDLDALITFLGARVFAGGLISKEFYVYHDPKHDFTVGADDVGIGRHLSHRAELGRTRRLNRLTCRRTTDGKLVFLSHRDKSAFSVLLKIQRQIKQGKLENPFVIHDRCGLMFVVEREEDIVDLAGAIARQIVRDGGEVIEALDGNYGKDAAADPKNDTSSKAYKVAKMIVRWHGREFELQFATFADHFNSTSSLSDANHALYKLRQARRYAFPKLWPESVYGINWDSGHVSAQMNAWMTARLGWRVNGHHTSETP